MLVKGRQLLIDTVSFCCHSDTSQLITCLLHHAYEVLQAEITASRSDADTCQSPRGAGVLAGSGAGTRVTQGGCILPASVGFCASSAGEPWYLNASLSQREINVKLEAVLNLESLGISL